MAAMADGDASAGRRRHQPPPPPPARARRSSAGDAGGTATGRRAAVGAGADATRGSAAVADVRLTSLTKVFDGVTAGLRVSTSPHDPLLCTDRVLDIASGDLSLPGKVS